MSGRRTNSGTGLLYGFGAYGMWGLVPLFWPLLKPAGAVEILAHRMVWSLAVVGIALLALRRWAWIGELLRQPQQAGSRSRSPRPSSPSTGACTSGP